MATKQKPSLHAFTVTGEGDKAFWTRIGTAWPHKSGEGFPHTRSIGALNMSKKKSAARAIPCRAGSMRWLRTGPDGPGLTVTIPIAKKKRSVAAATSFSFTRASTAFLDVDG